MPEPQTDPAHLRNAERIALERSAEVKLTFNEASARQFVRKMRELEKSARRAYRLLAKENAESASSASQGVEILLDNFYIVNNALAEIADRRKGETIKKLPQSLSKSGVGLPRVYGVARTLVRESDTVLSNELIGTFIETYQRAAPLTVREIDIFPDMLRTALIEEVVRHADAALMVFGEISAADAWFLKFSRVAGDERAQARLATELVEKYKIIPHAFGARLIQRITQSGREQSLRVAVRRLKFSLGRQGIKTKSFSDSVIDTGRTKSITNAIESLRWLSHIRWDRIAIRLHAVDAILTRDPAHVFSRLTEDSRSWYRREIVRLSDRTGVPDIDIAKKVMQLSRAASGESSDISEHKKTHVGYYLIDKGASALESSFGYSPTVIESLRRYIIRHATSAYLGGMAVCTLACAGLLLWHGVPSGVHGLWVAAALLPALLLGSEIASAFLHTVLTSILAPHILPVIDVSSGVGEDQRTIVVMSAPFRDPSATNQLIERLETNAVANADPNILFALLMDLPDAAAEILPEDNEKIAYVQSKIEELNARYPSPRQTFHMFYQRRTWNPSEGVYMSWERKRGKLWEFNALLRGEETSFAADPREVVARLGGIRYVLTLDEDTELLRGSAAELIGTISHPLNRPVIDLGTRTVKEGYGIIQPRIALRFKEGARSFFARLFGNHPGLDVYSPLVSSLHQDLFGEGVFFGKGIYDIDAVVSTMHGRIPENTVLSHDLLEGLYARVHTAHNAYVFEGFPSRYTEYALRLHRWIRGDWQSMRWLGRRGSILSLAQRYLIFDNMRRSLIPVAGVAVLAISFALPGEVLWWSIAILAVFSIGQVFSTAVHLVRAVCSVDFWIAPRGYCTDMARSVWHTGAKAVLQCALLPAQALTSVDAITRSIWRSCVSKRHLLEWRTAHDVARRFTGSIKEYTRRLWPCVLAGIALVAAMAEGIMNADDFLPWAVWAMLFLSAPLLAYLAGRGRKRVVRLAVGDRAYMRKVAARTLWFFLDFATKDTSWLIPDHFQEEPASKKRSFGLGISPTNLGMYLLSLSVSRSLGFLSFSAYAERMERASESMERMERHHGHFYNWYELHKLTPLPPRYVSSVDSANLVLALATVSGSLKEAKHEPLLSPRMFRALDAECSILADTIETVRARGISADNEARCDALAAEVSGARLCIAEALRLSLLPQTYSDTYDVIEAHATRIHRIADALSTENEREVFDEILFAVRHIEMSVIAHRKNIFTLSGYALAVCPADKEGPLCDHMRAFYARAQNVPSLEDLATGAVREALSREGFLAEPTRHAQSDAERHSAAEWHTAVLKRLSQAETEAKRLLSAYERVARLYDAYVRDMDFRFLYDAERGLFRIGYNGFKDALDDGLYDLYASEANAVSIVAVAKAQVPKKHWTYLGRKLVKTMRGEIAIASWNGSLFEYLGTLIYFNPPYESLWGVSLRRAIAAHRSFGWRHRIPWGMGESASSARDQAHNYEYKAFGEPSIGFRRESSRALVVAPYTTALSLPFAPRAALANFRRLAREGGYGRYGFYDAIDYTEGRTLRKGEGVPVKTYYAHHQGFILASIANVLDRGLISRCVGHDSSLRAVTELFEEKMPTTTDVQTLHAETLAFHTQLLMQHKTNAFATLPHRYVSTRTREAHSKFISNGAYRVHLTNTGAGSSAYKDIHITTPCDDMLSEHEGTFWYIHDPATNAVWSATRMPAKTAGDKQSVEYGEHIAIFRKNHKEIESALTVTVAKDENIEVRSLALTNRRAEPVTLTLGICAPLSMVRPEEEAAQMNYERLFVATEYIPAKQAIIASRYDSRDRTQPIVAGFSLVSDRPPRTVHAFRTREAFFGSPASYERPPIFDTPLQAEDAPRHTLDSAAAFITSITLLPGETREVAYVSAFGHAQEEVLRLLASCSAYNGVRAIVAGAERAGVAVLQELGISPSQADLFSELGSLLYARARYGAPAALVASVPTADVLWKHGVSGRYPIMVFSVSGTRDLFLIRQMLLCHGYFVRKGTKADIIILNEHLGGYMKIFEDEIDFLIRTHEENTIEKPGGIYHIRSEQLTREEYDAITRGATLHLRAQNNTFADMVRSVARRAPPLLPAKRSHVKPTSVPESVPFPAASEQPLVCANGIGGYDAVRGVYQIRRAKDQAPPVPWANIVSNERIGFLATDRGVSFTWARNSHDNKLTVSHTDPLSYKSAETVYIRDDRTGVELSPLPILGDSSAEYLVSHGEGFTEYETVQNELHVLLRMHASSNGPVKYLTLEIRNLAPFERALTAFFHFEALLGSTPRETRKQLSYEHFPGNVISVHNTFRNSFGTSRALFGIAGGADAYAVTRAEFYGRPENIRAPAALARKTLSSTIAGVGEPGITLSHSIVIEPGGACTVPAFIAETSEHATIAKTAKQLIAADAKKDFHSLRLHSKRVPRPRITTPDGTIDMLVNQWLPYQTLSSRFYARAGFSQISGAFGFRDQLQDALAILWYAPDLVRAHILSCAARQFKEGDVLAWWHPHNGLGARTLLSDPHLWLPYVVARYIAHTGDSGVLHERIPFLDGEKPNVESRSVVAMFSPSGEEGTLYEHCVRAVEHGLTRGPHGLPLIGTADWNDAMNALGLEGKGESVWLAWLTIDALQSMARMAEEQGEHDRARRYRNRIDAYRTDIAAHAWDGKWYRRAYTDSGAAIGSENAQAFRIDSLSQSWAVMEDGKTEKTITALESVYQELQIEKGHVPLMTPSLSRHVLDLGTISDYPEGVRENGAQYNHAALWLAEAYFRMGDAEKGLAILDAVNPFKRSSSKEKVKQYRGEPYVVAAEIYSAPTYPGRAGWTWYTASAGVFYRVVLEHLFGIRREGHRVSFRPVFPRAWNTASVSLPFGKARYDVRYARATKDNAPGVRCDGVALADEWVHLIDDKKVHRVDVYF